MQSRRMDRHDRKRNRRIVLQIVRWVCRSKMVKLAPGPLSHSGRISLLTRITITDSLAS